MIKFLKLSEILENITNKTEIIEKLVIDLNQILTYVVD